MEAESAAMSEEKGVLELQVVEVTRNMNTKIDDLEDKIKDLSSERNAAIERELETRRKMDEMKKTDEMVDVNISSAAGSSGTSASEVCLQVATVRQIVFCFLYIDCSFSWNLKKK